MVEEKMDKKIEEQKEKIIEDFTTSKSNDAKTDNTKPDKVNESVEKSSVSDNKSEDKAEKKKSEVVKGDKKTEVKVSGRDLRISTKQAVAICKFIRGKDVDKAIEDLGDVVKMKRAVPMKGEIPHRKGKGMMSGRYPAKAALEFIKLLKSVKANAINHEVELEKVRISCMANVASRPYRRFGRERFKRSHVEIKLTPFKKKGKSKTKKKITEMHYSNKNKQEVEK